MKPWIERATELLSASLKTIPHEPNELDWKQSLSPDKRRLCEHLSAFGNQEGGGFLVFGIDNQNARILGVESKEAERIINQLANLARQGVEPPLRIDHVIIEFKENPILFIHVLEGATKPVHLRGQSIEKSGSENLTVAGE